MFDKRCLIIWPQPYDRLEAGLKIHQTCFLLIDVIHTVGPFGRNRGLLEQCYTRCLDTALNHKIKTLVRFIDSFQIDYK